jgi:hypothetical protein
MRHALILPEKDFLQKIILSVSRLDLKVRVIVHKHAVDAVDTLHIPEPLSPIAIEGIPVVTLPEVIEIGIGKTGKKRDLTESDVEIDMSGEFTGG